jgi:hypothetical protein
MGHKDKISEIATRAVMAAQIAVAIRTETKNILKLERRKNGGVPIYYAQNIATMVSHSAEMTGQLTASSLAALEHLDLARRARRKSENIKTIQAADLLAQSAAHQAMSTKLMHEALVAALASQKIADGYDGDSE